MFFLNLVIVPIVLPFLVNFVDAENLRGGHLPPIDETNYDFNASIILDPPEQRLLTVDTTNSVGLHPEINHDSYTSSSNSSAVVHREQHHRTLSTGSHSVMILRIIVNGNSPRTSAQELNNYVFDHDNSLRNQLSRCSAGALSLKQSAYGVIDLPISASSPNNHEALIAAANQVLMWKYPSVGGIRNMADHTIFVVPSAGNDWVGWGEVGNKITMFNDAMALSLSSLMHEIGHNLGLQHGSRGGEAYGDWTTAMGISVTTQGGPSYCYNAANFWYLNWYRDRRVSLSPGSNPSTVNVAAFVDYAQASGSVLVNVGDLYMLYNRAKSYNSGTRLFPDKLVIIHSTSSSSPTQLVAALDTTNSRYTSSSGVVIEVCNAGTQSSGVDFMVVSIGQGRTNCGANASSNNRQQNNRNRNRNNNNRNRNRNNNNRNRNNNNRNSWTNRSNSNRNNANRNRNSHANSWSSDWKTTGSSPWSFDTDSTHAMSSVATPPEEEGQPTAETGFSWSSPQTFWHNRG